MALWRNRTAPSRRDQAAHTRNFISSPSALRERTPHFSCLPDRPLAMYSNGPDAESTPKPRRINRCLFGRPDPNEIRTLCDEEQKTKWDNFWGSYDVIGARLCDELHQSRDLGSMLDRLDVTETQPLSRTEVSTSRSSTHRRGSKLRPTPYASRLITDYMRVRKREATVTSKGQGK